MTDALPCKEPIPLTPPSQPIEGDSHSDFIVPLRELGPDSLHRRDPRASGRKVRRLVRQQAQASRRRRRSLQRHGPHARAEIAHALGIGYEQYDREQAEVLLDCATYIVCSSVGLDGGGESIPTSPDGQRRRAGRLKAYADTIDTVARRIEDALQPAPETVDGVHAIAA